MMPLIEANWPILLIALLIGIAIAWFAFAATRKTSVVTERKDVLDEGAAPAQRNQALIDTPARPAGNAPPASPVMAAPDIVPAAAVGAAMATMQSAPADPMEHSGKASEGRGDDLTRIKGLGPKLAARLGELGVTRLEQIAAWTENDIARIDPQLGRFQGRIERDQWVEQALLLAAGDEDGYAARFGNNG